jgi:hypothetical protein
MEGRTTDDGTVVFLGSGYHHVDDYTIQLPQREQIITLWGALRAIVRASDCL